MNLKLLKDALLRTKLGYRGYLRYQGHPAPKARPVTSNYNSVLQTRNEWEKALEQVEALGLPPHPDPPKSWDSLAALSLILERTESGARILDAGSELYSVILPWLFLYGYEDLWGVNLELDRAHKRGPIRYEYGDITRTRFDDETFDTVTCLSVIEHGVNLELYFKEMSRILRRNGHLITSTDYWDFEVDTSGKVAYGVPIHVFTKEEIYSALNMAKRFHLEPISQLNLDCGEKAVRWYQYNLDYTYLLFSLQKKID